MTDHDAVRAGDEGETIDLLLRLAQQATRRIGSPPPDGHRSWTKDACRELVSETYLRKPQFVEKALVATVTDRDLELYLLTAFENVLRDQGRETERGKLIERLKTILGQADQFIRHSAPFDAWRLNSAPPVAWQGDIGHLIRAARKLRDIAVTEWNTAGKTPKATRDAIVRVCEAALDEAAGFVRDPDVAHVVQVCIPAVPLEPTAVERPVAADDPGVFEDLTQNERPQPDESTAAAVAAAIWGNLTYEERRAVPHLASARQVGEILGLPRRTASAVTESTKDKIRAATSPAQQAAVVDDLIERAHALAGLEEGSP